MPQVMYISDVMDDDHFVSRVNLNMDAAKRVLKFEENIDPWKDIVSKAANLGYLLEDKDFYFVHAMVMEEGSEEEKYSLTLQFNKNDVYEWGWLTDSDPDLEKFTLIPVSAAAFFMQHCVAEGVIERISNQALPWANRLHFFIHFISMNWRRLDFAYQWQDVEENGGESSTEEISLTLMRKGVKALHIVLPDASVLIVEDGLIDARNPPDENFVPADKELQRDWLHAVPPQGRA